MPSGLKATDQNRLVYPLQVFRRLYLLISQNLTVWSSLLLASIGIFFSLGLKAIDQTRPLCPRKGKQEGFVFECVFPKISSTFQSITLLSLLPLARSFPSGLKVTNITQSLCSFLPKHSLVSRFLNITLLSSPPLASSLPSGLKATDQTRFLCSSFQDGVSTGLPVLTSQSITLPSSPALASSLPSGLKATERTHFLYFSCCKILGYLPVLTSQSITVPSSLPLASCLPSGLNATDQTRFLCSCKV